MQKVSVLYASDLGSGSSADLYLRNRLGNDEFTFRASKGLDGAVSLLKKQEFDVVITEVRLLEEGHNLWGTGYTNLKEGVKLVRWIKKHKPSTLIVVWTLHSDPYLQQMMEAGADLGFHKYQNDSGMREQILKLLQAKKVA